MKRTGKHRLWRVPLTHTRYNSLIYYLKAWLFIASYLEERGLPPMNYYFHAAETDWYKDRASNLYDAVLLNSKRIGKRINVTRWQAGHGFAIPNYPLLQESFRENGIAIEVCPISNQLLRVVQDLRVHPAREMMSNGLAITINSDDSVIYGNPLLLLRSKLQGTTALLMITGWPTRVGTLPLVVWRS